MGFEILEHVMICQGPHKDTRGVLMGIWTDRARVRHFYVQVNAETQLHLQDGQVKKIRTPHADLFLGPPVPITWIDRLFIPQKVCDKYYRRSNCPTNPRKIPGTIRKLLRASKEIQLKPRFRPITLMNHHLEEARYYFCSGWLIVVAGETVRTIYRMKNQHRFEM